MDLKKMMIQYIIDHLNDRFYNQNDLYMTYKENNYEYILFEDFATNDSDIKLFSIKTICFLASDIHS